MKIHILLIFNAQLVSFRFFKRAEEQDITRMPEKDHQSLSLIRLKARLSLYQIKMSSQNDDDLSEFQSHTSRVDLFKNRGSALFEPAAVSKGLITHQKETNQIEFEKDQDLNANYQKRVPKGLPEQKQGLDRSKKRDSNSRSQPIKKGGTKIQMVFKDYDIKYPGEAQQKKKIFRQSPKKKLARRNIDMKVNTSENSKNSIEAVNFENPPEKKNQQEQKSRKSSYTPEKSDISSKQEKRQMTPEKMKNLKNYQNRSWIQPESIGQSIKQPNQTPPRKKKISITRNKQQISPEKYQKESQIQKYSSSKKLLSPQRKEIIQVQQFESNKDKDILALNEEKERRIIEQNKLNQIGKKGKKMEDLPQKVIKPSTKRIKKSFIPEQYNQSMDENIQKPSQLLVKREVGTPEQYDQSVNEFKKFSQQLIKRESFTPEQLDHLDHSVDEEDQTCKKASQLLTKRKVVTPDHSVHEEDNILQKTSQPFLQRQDQQFQYSPNEKRHILETKHFDKREKDVITPKSLENRTKVLGHFPGNTLHIEESDLMENESYNSSNYKKIMPSEQSVNEQKISKGKHWRMIKQQPEEKQSSINHPQLQQSIDNIHETPGFITTTPNFGGSAKNENSESSKYNKSQGENNKHQNNKNLCQSEIQLTEIHSFKSNSDRQQQKDNYFKPIPELYSLKSQLYSKIRRKDGLEMELQIDQSWSKYFSPQYTLKFYSEREEEKRVLMRAKKTSSFPCSTFIITCQEGDFKEGSPSYLGTIKSNVFGDVFNVFGPGISLADAKNNKQGQPRELLATIVFTRQYIPTGLPRKFSVYVKKEGCRYYRDFPEVRDSNQQIPLNKLHGNKSEKKNSEENSLNQTQQLSQKNKSAEKNYSVEDKISEDSKNQEKIDLYQNRKPKWIEGCRAYMLKLGKKGKEPSTKNFILEESSNGRELVLLSKDSDKKFYMKMGPPLSPFIAFAVALSNFSKRLIGQ